MPDSVIGGDRRQPERVPVLQLALAGVRSFDH